MRHTHPPQPAAIRTEGIIKGFRGLQVLCGIDLEVQPATLTALLGSNGAGKTTLVRILTTLLRPDGGSASVAGHDLATDPRSVRRDIALTGQSVTVDEILTAEENLRLIGRLRRLSGADTRRRAAELLEIFDLTDAAHRRVSTFSGGMRRRLDLAASLITRPKVLFLDEPTTGLDPASRRDLWNVIHDLTRNGTTILLTTQYLEEADVLADQVAMLHGGRIAVEGTPAELKARVGDERLILSFHDRWDAATAASALSLTAPTGAETEVSLPVFGPDDVRVTLDRLAAAGITATRLALTPPTLDDVFFAITETEPMEVS